MEERTVKTIRVFLASSNELHDDRVNFADFIMRLKKHYETRNYDFQLEKWEYLNPSYTNKRKQDEYNQVLCQSDSFVALFYSKAGEYTVEEFDIAVDECRKRGLPLLIYFRELQGENEPESLKNLKGRIANELQYFWGTYDTNDKLHLDFALWLDNFLFGGKSDIKVNGDEVTMDGMKVAEMSQLSFAANNEAFKRMYKKLQDYPEEIEELRRLAEKYPEEQVFRDNLQKTLDRRNALSEEFEQYKQTLLDTAKFIADKLEEQTSQRYQRAAALFESGDMAGANTILNEIVLEADEFNKNFEHDREQMHEYIDAFQLQAKTEMGDLKTTIEERITRVAEIYAKADDWADRSAYDKKKYAQLLFDYAQFLNKYGLYDKAEKILIHQIALSEKVNGKESTETAKSYNEIGLVYRRQGIYAKALEYYFKSLAIKEKVLSADHPDTAATYNNIGIVYYDQGKYKEALEYHFKSLAIKEKVLGADHPNTATSYNNIGNVYYDQGKYKEALDYHFKALAIKEKVLSADHPDTAASYNNIGNVYKRQGKYKEALEYYFKDLAISEKVLGTDHPDTATSYNNIGTAYYGQGKYKEALEYLNKALEIREKKLGHDHPLTKQTRDNIKIVENKRH